MTKDSRVLYTLADTLDLEAALKKHNLHSEDLKAVLLRAASLMAELEKPPSQDEVFTIHTDGASRGNPGPAGAGVMIYKGDKMVEGLAQYLGRKTNNQAEYNALIMGLERAAELGATKVVARTDSELMVMQIKGVYKVKNPRLKKLFARVSELINKFDSFEIEHVYREENWKADQLANRAIDEFKDED